MSTELLLGIVIIVLVVAIFLGYACYSDLRKDIQTMAIGLANHLHKDAEANRYRLDDIQKQLNAIAERLDDNNILTNSERKSRNEVRLYS